MNNTNFRPAAKGLAAACPPTEIDDEWRKCVVKGYVHDPACAILGGITGNAGLFSNVYDVCKLMYMFKNGGEYGRRIYLEPETVKKFSTKQVSFSRRGWGFDKPNSDPERSGEVSSYASEEAYGHLGFTGNSVWIDPKYDLVFVFLSNRTYPNPHSKAFNRRHVRKEVMDLVYESMMRRKES
jgi:CubicO group peptidase (beta-lactamase class C family)